MGRGMRTTGVYVCWPEIRWPGTARGEHRSMVIGVPREVKDHETRVGLVPSAVLALREAGHSVLIETRAGEGSSLTDEEYARAGARIMNSAHDVWRGAELVIKVKEPQL